MNLFNKQSEEKELFVYTEEQLMARLKFFIGVCLALTLTGIVFVVLYSLIFVTQPLNAISPIDQKFFELIVPIATFLTGTLSGIMLAGNDKAAQAEALKAANSGWSKPPSSPTPPTGGMGMPPRPPMPSMPGMPQMPQMPMGNPMSSGGWGVTNPATVGLEPGDPVARNTRND